MQLVLMHLNPNEDIPMEIHHNATQFIYLVQGKVEVISGSGERKEASVGDEITIGPDTKHQIVALDHTYLFTLYSPPQY